MATWQPGGVRSRDIDVFIDCRGDFLREFARAVEKIGFAPGEYKFRHTGSWIGIRWEN